MASNKVSNYTTQISFQGLPTVDDGSTGQCLVGQLSGTLQMDTKS
jgi:hypothetical protein